jgi:hypothetical protein
LIHLKQKGDERLQELSSLSSHVFIMADYYYDDDEMLAQAIAASLEDMKQNVHLHHAHTFILFFMSRSKLFEFSESLMREFSERENPQLVAF